MSCCATLSLPKGTLEDVCDALRLRAVFCFEGSQEGIPPDARAVLAKVPEPKQLGQHFCDGVLRVDFVRRVERVSSDVVVGTVANFERATTRSET
jgi:hypothetical protein